MKLPNSIYVSVHAASMLPENGTALDLSVSVQPLTDDDVRWVRADLIGKQWHGILTRMFDRMENFFHPVADAHVYMRIKQMREEYCTLPEQE